MTYRTRLTKVLILIVLVSPGALALAAESPEGTEPVWVPPVHNEESISLIDAVRVTLAHNPTLQLQKETARFAYGVFQEEAGAFDTSLLAELSFDYQLEDLRASSKNSEQETRDDLRTELDDTQTNLQAARDSLDQLLALQTDPTGSTLPSDPNLQALIDLFNAEINAAPNQAARDQLIADRDDAIRRAIIGQTDDLNEIQDDLDEVARDIEDLGSVPQEQEIASGFLNLSISKPTRRGFSFGPFLEYTSESNKYVGKPVDSKFGGKGIEDLYRATLGFNFDTPLARGLGVKSAAAAEKSAGIQHEASLADLEHSVATSVLSTVLSYWDAQAAFEAVKIREESARIQSDLRKTTEALIRADELPRFELARAKAGEADALAGLDAAKRAAHQARLRLASVVGLSVETTGQAPLPTEPFPPPLDPSGLDAVNVADLVARATESRADYRSARLLEKSSQILTTAAEMDRKPLVDLKTKLWYNAIGEGSASQPFSEDIVGPSYSLELDVEWPFGNNVQRGRFVQAEARSRTSSIVTADLGRTIRSGVVEVYGSLERAVEQLRFSQEAVGHYRRSLDFEVERFRSGASTLIDTLLTQQRLISAMLDEVVAKQQYAQLLVQLRFETGTLVNGSHDEGFRIEEAALVTPPK